MKTHTFSQLRVGDHLGGFQPYGGLVFPLVSTGRAWSAWMDIDSPVVLVTQWNANGILFNGFLPAPTRNPGHSICLPYREDWSSTLVFFPSGFQHEL